MRNSGIHIDIELSELNLYPIYEDVNYDGVNDVILNASPGTYAFRLKQPLLEIANQFCRSVHIHLHNINELQITILRNNFKFISCMNDYYIKYSFHCPINFSSTLFYVTMN
ncbi:unnamed protein product [Schistosoma margrebowiei]|uniref:Uncharacterized protein n=1 Tax=Schistosoma margrebowiei TaxID=48269 RepID=A0A183LIC6_9TREM|nr:unnamed protein product [Schistosoma margrebowiei]